MVHLDDDRRRSGLAEGDAGLGRTRESDGLGTGGIGDVAGILVVGLVNKETARARAASLLLDLDREIKVIASTAGHVVSLSVLVGVHAIDKRKSRRIAGVGNLKRRACRQCDLKVRRTQSHQGYADISGRAIDVLVGIGNRNAHCRAVAVVNHKRR